MMPYIVLAAIGLGIEALEIAAAIFTLNLGGIAFSIIGLAIGIHFFSVVWSYKEQVKEERSRITNDDPNLLPLHLGDKCRGGGILRCKKRFCGKICFCAV